MDGNQQVVQVLDSNDLPVRSFMVMDKGYLSRPLVAIPGRWIPAIPAGMMCPQHFCITASGLPFGPTFMSMRIDAPDDECHTATHG